MLDTVGYRVWYYHIISSRYANTNTIISECGLVTSTFDESGGEKEFVYVPGMLGMILDD